MSSKKASVPRRGALIASGVLFVILSAVLVDMVVDIWPTVGVQSEICKQAEAMPPAEREPFLEKMHKGYKISCRFKDVPITRVNLEGLRMFLSPDQGLFGLVAMFAALGALIRSLRSVAWIAAGRSDGEGSVGWNLLRPLVGALLACVVYVALRAMLLPSGTLAAANPYGFIAIAALIGLFCDELLCWGLACGRSLLSKAK
ncbi:MAG: hypothetical protein ACE5FM_06365 [Methyloligellaceae bacterium]